LVVRRHHRLDRRAGDQRLSGALPAAEPEHQRPRLEPDVHHLLGHRLHADDHELVRRRAAPAGDRLPGLHLLGLPQARHSASGRVMSHTLTARHPEPTPHPKPVEGATPLARRQRFDKLSARLPGEPPPQRTEPARGSDRSRPLDPRLIRRAAPVRHQLIISSILGTLTAVSVVAIAWCIAYGVGTAFTDRSAGPLISIAPWLAGAFVARGLLSWLTEVIAARTASAVKSQLRREVAESYL